MKKGFWQSEKHSEVYGNSFKDVTFFDHEIPKYIIDNYIKPLYAKNNGVCDLYEFGVYTGGTLKAITHQLKKNEIYINKVYGFDSFQGLPKEEEGKQIEGDHWLEGAFSSCDALKIWTWEELEKSILNNINCNKVKLIKGYYQDTLKKDILEKYDFKPALFVHIDVDLYKSTKEVLTWLIENKLIMVDTIIRYDDVFFVPEDTGELLAHYEICKKYNVNCKRLLKDYFVVNSIG